MNPDRIDDLIDFIEIKSGGLSKATLEHRVIQQFELTRERSVYRCSEFAIRFISAKKRKCANTVVALSTIRKYDHLPFLICIVTPVKNFLVLANSTFLIRVSHSSHALTQNNIRGSINVPDIMLTYAELENNGSNVHALFRLHVTTGFCGNIRRIVENTNNIVGIGGKFEVTRQARRCIMEAPERALRFYRCKDYWRLKKQLDHRVRCLKHAIKIAADIENVNTRGRAIECLVSNNEPALVNELIDSLTSSGTIPGSLKTKNELGDIEKVINNTHVQIDVKSKLMATSSNPKAYNLDKFLGLLQNKNSVFMFYFVGVHKNGVLSTALVSVFDCALLDTIKLQKHWSGRNSRGVSQFNGESIAGLLRNHNKEINMAQSKEFLDKVIAL